MRWNVWWMLAALLCVAPAAADGTSEKPVWAEVIGLHGDSQAVTERLQQVRANDRSIVVVVLQYDLFLFQRTADGGYEVTTYNCAEWATKGMGPARAALDDAIACRKDGKGVIALALEGKKGQALDRVSAPRNALDLVDPLRGKYATRPSLESSAPPVPGSKPPVDDAEVLGKDRMDVTLYLFE